MMSLSDLKFHAAFFAFALLFVAQSDDCTMASYIDCASFYSSPKFVLLALLFSFVLF